MGFEINSYSWFMAHKLVNENQYTMKITMKGKKVMKVMKDQIDKLVGFFDKDVTGTVATPVNRNLMSVDTTSKKLCTKKNENFHSTISKLLYIKKQARPDMELVTAFLNSKGVIQLKKIGSN